MSIQEFGNVPATGNEMAIGDGMVAMSRSLIGKLQWMTTLKRPDLSKKLNDALSLLNTGPTWGVIRALNNVVSLQKRRPIQSLKLRKLSVILQMELTVTRVKSVDQLWAKWGHNSANSQQVGESHGRCTKIQQRRKTDEKRYCDCTFIDTVWGNKISFRAHPDNDSRPPN